MHLLACAIPLFQNLCNVRKVLHLRRCSHLQIVLQVL